MWIARDANGELCLFKDKPTLYGVNFYSKCDGFNLDESLFPKVTFENSPIEVGLKTKSKLKHNYDWKEMSELNSLTESTPCILAYIDENRRAEDLSIEEYLNLTKLLQFGFSQYI